MDEKSIVTAFLERCNTYARASISRKKERGDDEEIPRWESYVEFNQHAIEEIAKGTLNRWFEENNEHTPPLNRLDVDAMTHVERSIWLNNVLSPRPVVVAGTLDSNGQRNFAPLSSVMAVSTVPPYLTASFSVHKDGRHRDTLTNMRSTGRIILNLMPATQRGVELVDETATPLPQGEDEGMLINALETVDSQPLLLSEGIAAIEAEYVEEHELPGAVARIAVMRVTAVWFSSSTAPAGGLAVLCQHGRDDMTPAPTGWTKRVTKHYG